MGIFDGIENVTAEGTSTRQYFEPGSYVVTIDSVFLYERRLGGGKLFIVETTVEKSDNPRITPGEQRNWVQSFAIPPTLSRIKSFIGAAMGLCPQRQAKDINSMITEDLCNEVVGPNNSLCGKRLKLNCLGKITQKGKEFIQHNWSAIHE